MPCNYLNLLSQKQKSCTDTTILSNRMQNSMTSTEQRQFSLMESTKNLEPILFIKMKKHESMWDGHMSPIDVGIHSIVMNPTNALPIHSQLYRAGSRQRAL